MVLHHGRAAESSAITGITIDTSQVRFSIGRRRYLIIDAPGHKEFLKNIGDRRQRAEAGVLVVDTVEGVSEQTLRHAYLLHLLGIRDWCRRQQDGPRRL